MIIKINKSQGRIIVAICDANLIGKKFEDGNTWLDLSAPFYQGKKSSIGQVRDLFKKADNLNLVGTKTIQLALQENVISQESIRKIKNIPFASIAAFSQS